MASTVIGEENEGALICGALHERTKNAFKIRCKKQKYFKLYKQSKIGKARLEGYATKERSLVNPPESVILLSNVAKIETDPSCENSIMVVEDGRTTIFEAESKVDQKNWLHALRSLMLEPTTCNLELNVQEIETINEVYDNFVQDPKEKNLQGYNAIITKGNLLKKLTSSKVVLKVAGGSLFIFDAEGIRKQGYSLKNIRKYGIKSDTVFIETGRYAVGGEDIIHFQMSKNEAKKVNKLLSKEQDEIKIAHLIENAHQRLSMEGYESASKKPSLPPPILKSYSFEEKPRPHSQGELLSSKSLDEDDEDEVYYNPQEEEYVSLYKQGRNRSGTIPPMTFRPPTKLPLIKLKESKATNCVQEESFSPTTEKNCSLEEEGSQPSEKFKYFKGIRNSNNEDTYTDTTGDPQEIIYCGVDKNISLFAKNDGRKILLKPKNSKENIAEPNQAPEVHKGATPEVYAMPIKKHPKDQYYS